MNKHHNFEGTCTNCGHPGEQHFGYKYTHVICWDKPGRCMCSVFLPDDVQCVDGLRRDEYTGQWVPDSK